MKEIFATTVGSGNFYIIWDKDDNAFQFITKDMNGKVVNSFKIETGKTKTLAENIMEVFDEKGE